jgi:RNA recognition motif-containing protein
MDSAALAALANSVRPVVSARVIVNPVTDVSRQYGFVLFQTPADAQAAVRALHRRRVGRRTITCRLALSVVSMDPSVDNDNDADVDHVADDDRLSVAPAPDGADDGDDADADDTTATVAAAAAAAADDDVDDHHHGKPAALLSTTSSSTTSSTTTTSTTTTTTTSSRGRRPAAPPSNRLFVRGFPGSFTRDDLLQLFEPFGNVLECVLLLRADQRTSKQIALVSMASRAEATAALHALHGYRIGDCPTIIDVRYRRRAPPSGDDGASDDSLSVSSLNIVGLLSPQLLASPPPLSPPSGVSPRSSAHSPVSWSPFSAANSFLSPLNTAFLSSSGVGAASAAPPVAAPAWGGFSASPTVPDVTRPRPRRGRVGSGGAPALSPANASLFVHSESATADESKLRALFEPFGQTVQSLFVARAPDGSSRGFGFVQFDSPLAANTAMLALNGTLHEGRRMKVSFSKRAV